MKQQQILWGVVGLVVLISVGYMFFGGQDSGDYRQEILDERERQYKFLRYNEESPLTDAQKLAFDSLICFPVDEKYKVRARMVPLQQKQFLEIPMTDGSMETYLKHSYVDFELGGKSCRLLLLQAADEPDKKNFFLPFADQTSGELTYGGGRYLNLRQDGINSVTIDFNLAYNPYCAYNPDFACPIPPRENILDVPIKAGEKNYLK
ncbi:DUF1684 domain-containing protein [Echinicola vietnamensis]|uniref:DUF1684 domain-containing protein n=1 Tax=Echinicola vietnamensis (strain DSM 17526 / LMG 23754 / KMM 6221) TaxID=926556 RepID=L0FTF7_ECHVK|nr:DUF1684 domain-containing protein [Echinicola vietnamensis]AGA76328.1 Protein of unknown function (DUF1684) [Echinicola vietnamensis DSM 17526]